MGMDLTIYSARNHEIFKHDGWWNSPEVEEKYYSCKFFELFNNCSFIPNTYENNEFLEINHENLEEMISIACMYRNYWGTYDDVPKLCELRDEYDFLVENGKKLYLNCNW